MTFISTASARPIPDNFVERINHALAKTHQQLQRTARRRFSVGAPDYKEVTFFVQVYRDSDNADHGLHIIDPSLYSMVFLSGSIEAVDAFEISKLLEMLRQSG